MEPTIYDLDHTLLYGHARDDSISRFQIAQYIFVAATLTIVLSAFCSVLFFTVSSNLVTMLSSNQKVQIQPYKIVSTQATMVNTVKSANPAVVSIIISQEVANIPQFNPLDPFGFLNNGNSSGGTTKQEVGGGSGFIISQDGLIITNKHVASTSSDTYTAILSDGTQYDAKIVATDPTNDISILRINASNLPTLQLGDSTTLQLGQSVIAIGNALGQYENTVDSGVVSGIDRTVTASEPGTSSTETLTNVIQTDAQINPGNSGGPLLDLTGKVIGINSAVAQNAQGIGFAIPIEQAKNDIASVESTGKILKPELGLRYVMLDSTFVAQNPGTPYDYGAYVTSNTSSLPAVISGSPADKAGIQQGDILLEVNGVKLNADHQLSSVIGQFNLGDTIKVKLYHQGSEKTISVTLDKSF